MDCKHCTYVELKCCSTCMKNTGDCEVCHSCGKNCPEYQALTNEMVVRTRWTTEQLAEALIKFGTRPTVDYDWDENPIESMDEEFWTTSDGEECYDKETAIVHETVWLYKPATENMEETLY